MWRIEDAHIWMMQPYTSYEIRRELRVRESLQTAITWDRKYFNIDTCKYDTDRLPTLYSIPTNIATAPDSPGIWYVYKAIRRYDDFDFE